MSDETTDRLALPYLAAGQAQKEVIYNEALQRIDAVIQPVALSADVATPPVSPAMGACWIVAAGGTGAWAGHDGDLAQWTPGGWRFAHPGAGWRCHVQDRGADMVHAGGLWVDAMLRVNALFILDEQVDGPRMGAVAEASGGTIIDVEARSVINEILTVIRTHGLIGS